MKYARFAVVTSLVVAPLLIGALLVGLLGWGPEHSWSGDDHAEAAGAPMADSPQGVDQGGQLVEARRAAGGAGSQAGFLVNGTGRLKDGTGQFRARAEELTGGAADAQTAITELADGLTKLQAATGQLGNGATELADGVGGAVDEIRGVAGNKRDLLAAVDGVIHDLERSPDQRVRDLAPRLKDFRGEVDRVDVDAVINGDLKRLADGSRDLANQLSTPGYGFHDGIYAATKGAGDLKNGMGDLTGGVDEAVDGVRQLDDGAQRVDEMANRTRDAITGVQRTLPVVWGTGEEGAPSSSFAPVNGVLLGVVASFGGIIVAGMWRRRRLDALLALGGIAAMTGVMFPLLGHGAGVASVIGALVVLALAAVASAGLTILAVQRLGARVGTLVALGVGALQTLLVGFVWQRASTGEVPWFFEVLSSLFPLHHLTGALSTLGNGGDAALYWLGVAILGVLSAATLLLAYRGRRPSEQVGAAGEVVAA